MSDAMTSLIDGIMYAVKTLINKAEYDQTVSGHIRYYAGNNKYVVNVNGDDYAVKSNGLFHTFDSVEITKPKNKWLNAYISYPNTVNVTAEDLSSEAEVLRQEAEEIRIANENKRIISEQNRQDYHAKLVAKSESYDTAEAARVISCSTAIQEINAVKSSIETSYDSIQSNYNILSQDASTTINNCEEVIARCTTAAKKCEDISANGYVTNDQLSGLCKLVQENGKVYLEVI